MAQRKKSTLRQGGKSITPTLPDDVLTDLKNTMDLAKSSNEEQVITRADFKNIMHNFGYFSVRQKEFEEELRKYGLDPKQATFTDAEVINVITNLWCQRGHEEEARDCFRIFDKK